MRYGIVYFKCSIYICKNYNMVKLSIHTFHFKMVLIFSIVFAVFYIINDKNRSPKLCWVLVRYVILNTFCWAKWHMFMIIKYVNNCSTIGQRLRKHFNSIHIALCSSWERFNFNQRVCTLYFNVYHNCICSQGYPGHLGMLLRGRSSIVC